MLFRRLTLIGMLALQLVSGSIRPAAGRERPADSVVDNVYLTALFRAAELHGIYGTVTDRSSPARSIPLWLIFHDGQTWRELQETYTDFSGRYAFTDAPTLASGQGYFVRFLNGENPKQVRLWETRMITTYTAGEDVHLGVIDIGTIQQTSPVPGEIVDLPAIFIWEKRPDLPGASYEFELANLNPETEKTYFADAGSASQYTLETLPEGFFPGLTYYWCVWIHTPDGSRGASFYSMVFFLYGP